MCKGANLGAEIHSADLPVIDEAKILASQFIMPDNTYRNWNANEKHTFNLPSDLFAIVNDPQTNGGLMVAVENANKKGAVISKMAKEIIVSVKLGGPDPAGNSRLRMAIEAAKEVSVPKDTIERAIKRGSGQGDDSQIDEVVYEGLYNEINYPISMHWPL